MYSHICIISLLIVSSVFADDCSSRTEELVRDHVQSIKNYLINKDADGLRSMMNDPNLIYTHCNKIEGKDQLFAKLTGSLKSETYTKFDISEIDNVSKNLLIARVELAIRQADKTLIDGTSGFVFNIKKGSNGECQSYLSEVTFNCRDKPEADKARKSILPVEYELY